MQSVVNSKLCPEQTIMIYVIAVRQETVVNSETPYSNSVINNNGWESSGLWKIHLFKCPMRIKIKKMEAAAATVDNLIMVISGTSKIKNIKKYHS